MIIELQKKEKLTPGAKEFLVITPTPILEPSHILHELTMPILYRFILFLSIKI